VLNESSEKRDDHEVHLLAKFAVVDVGAFFDQSDQLFQELVSIFFGESSSNLVGLSSFLGDKSHD
jgi:hypothetical protein